MPRVRRCRYPNCHTLTQFPHYYCEQHRKYEAAYLKSREKWGHKPKQYEHKYNQVTRNRNEDKSNQYKFYRTRNWVHLRQQTLERDHYVCQYCKAIEKLTTNAKTVDHIVPIEFDDSKKSNLDNLATICRNCHRLKTKWKQDYYGTGLNQKPTSATEVTDLKAISLMMRAKK
ncbi:HNH endonuclease [Fructilactobacillus fructivorans]|uniref:Putative HNH nuclease YajD n=1 Tax=Fructilactobacillus fructivorans TaxID=1614 RepID=A0AAE6TWB1_9LACO|nr:HNH endonuclease [Fructilactobacillus fructivorans]KRK58493.1 HNH endonuclease [Fructilactobacillus fructivorans]KRN40045.1 HNH endonuclease [Fructilactobacillus fructivorans]QFX92502.1 HNH endonuclease [Fructilactobacillus fructivorans]RDV65902.1 HNH endonuclease [Fructilactobacillus fructivorans]